jgi:predicted nucleic acid-binding protein
LKTYLDSGVLIMAFRVSGEVGDRARQILLDTNREFALSALARLELLPKAMYEQRRDEVRFYQEYFAGVKHWARGVEQLLDEGYRIGCNYGLVAIDALHVAAALAVEANELVTTERSTKPMHRVKEIRVISIVG